MAQVFHHSPKLGGCCLTQPLLMSLLLPQGTVLELVVDHLFCSFAIAVCRIPYVRLLLVDLQSTMASLQPEDGQTVDWVNRGMTTPTVEISSHPPLNHFCRGGIRLSCGRILAQGTLIFDCFWHGDILFGCFPARFEFLLPAS